MSAPARNPHPILCRLPEIAPSAWEVLIRRHQRKDPKNENARNHMFGDFNCLLICSAILVLLSPPTSSFGLAPSWCQKAKSYTILRWPEICSLRFCSFSAFCAAQEDPSVALCGRCFWKRGGISSHVSMRSELAHRRYHWIPVPPPLCAWRLEGLRSYVGDGTPQQG